MPLDPAFFNSDLFRWVILPLLIFLARIADVSLGTIRIIFVSRGLRYLAPLVGFVEILIWIAAIVQIMQNLDNIACYLAYAGGFSAGTFIGITIENKLAMGMTMLRIITQNTSEELSESLKCAGFGVTCLEAKGLYQPVKVMFSIVKRRQLKRVLAILKQHDPKAVYTVEDVRSVGPSFHPSVQPVEHKLFKATRKGK